MAKKATKIYGAENRSTPGSSFTGINSGSSGSHHQQHTTPVLSNRNSN
jgi:hypothetical protein